MNEPKHPEFVSDQARTALITSHLRQSLDLVDQMSARPSKELVKAIRTALTCSLRAELEILEELEK